MLFEGNFGHNLYRYNWLWVAAFTSICLRLAVAQKSVAVKAGRALVSSPRLQQQES